MIRWHLVIHRAIDKFSKTIVCLKCSDNNTANTVMQMFATAINNYGLPDKVSTDLGGENTEVWRFMIEEHSSDSAVVTGSSTYNEWIEQLWRDIKHSVSSLFIELSNNLRYKIN